MVRSNRRIRRKGKSTASTRAALTGEPDHSTNGNALVTRTSKASSTPDVKMLAKALKLDVSDKLLDYAMGNDWKEKQQQQRQQQQETGKGKKKITKPLQMSTRERLKRKHTRNVIAKLATSTVDLRQSTQELQVITTKAIYRQADIWMMEAKYLCNISNNNRLFKEQEDDGSDEHNDSTANTDTEENSSNPMVSKDVPHRSIGASDTSSNGNNKTAKTKEHTVGRLGRLIKFWGSAFGRGSNSTVGKSAAKTTSSTDVNGAAKTKVGTTAYEANSSPLESIGAVFPKDGKNTYDAQVVTSNNVDTDKKDEPNTNVSAKADHKKDQDDSLAAKPKPNNKRADSPETCISDVSESECTTSTSPSSSFDSSDSEECGDNDPVQEEEMTSDTEDDSDNDSDDDSDDDCDDETMHLSDLTEGSHSDAFADLSQILFHPTLYQPMVTVKTARDLKRLKKTMTKAFLTQPELQKVVATSALVKKLEADHLRYGGNEDRCTESKGCRCKACKNATHVVVQTLVNSFLNMFVSLETKMGNNNGVSVMNSDKANDVGDQRSEE